MAAWSLRGVISHHTPYYKLLFDSSAKMVGCEVWAQILWFLKRNLIRRDFLRISSYYSQWGGELGSTEISVGALKGHCVDFFRCIVCMFHFVGVLLIFRN